MNSERTKTPRLTAFPPAPSILLRRLCKTPRLVARRVASAGDDEIYGLGTLTFLIGLHVEADALPLNKRFQPRTFNGGNVDEHIAAPVVWLDEAVAAFPVEKFDRTGHCH